MSSAERGSGRLSARRRKKRHRALVAIIVFIFLLLCACVLGLRQNAVRISRVEIFGADQSLSTTALHAMRGNYFGIVPRDSAFFFSETGIRAELLAAHPDIASVSIFRNGLTGLSIQVEYRVPIARWCPSTSLGQASSTFATSSPVGNCYLFDANGFIFSTTSVDSTTSTSSVQASSPQAMAPVNSFSVFGVLANENNPIGRTLPNAGKLPAAFNFARQLSTFGSPVSSIVFRADEVDDYLASGTRITYVLGDEQNAFTALMSARNDFNLADGSIEYVDLRFDGKIYLKKKDD
jgi:hypothetical protein